MIVRGQLTSTSDNAPNAASGDGLGGRAELFTLYRSVLMRLPRLPIDAKPATSTGLRASGIIKLGSLNVTFFC